MEGEIIRIKSISQLHQGLGLPKPKHPLISLIDASQMDIPESRIGSKLISDFYMISLKDKGCGMEYGRNTFDFEEGVLIFSGPGQVYTATQQIEKGDIQGWLLYFHPDLIRGTHLLDLMSDYSYFNYDVYEALHLSEDEEKTVHDCVLNIRNEYEQRIDNHSQRVIVSSLELLLNYSLRFYERQFNTRQRQGKDILTNFGHQLKAWFSDGRTLESGLPQIEYFSEKAHLSKHYFSDLIKKESGRSPKDHINEFVVERAKDLLMGTENSVSQIAYDLGFNYPHYFTRLFKSKTGQTPVEYRSLN